MRLTIIGEQRKLFGFGHFLRGHNKLETNLGFGPYSAAKDFKLVFRVVAIHGGHDLCPQTHATKNPFHIASIMLYIYFLF